MQVLEKKRVGDFTSFVLAATDGKALGDWLNHLDIERGLSRHTLRAYERDVTRYLAFLHGQGVAQLAAVDSRHVGDFLAGLRTGDPGHPALAASSAAPCSAA